MRVGAVVEVQDRSSCCFTCVPRLCGPDGGGVEGGPEVGTGCMSGPGKGRRLDRHRSTLYLGKGGEDSDLSPVVESRLRRLRTKCVFL